MNYLDFEEPIRLLREQLEQAQDIDGQGQVDMQSTVEDLEKKITEVSQEIYCQPEPLAARAGLPPPRPPLHPRPHRRPHRRPVHGTHGDRNCKDDKAMVGGLGMIDDLP